MRKGVAAEHARRRDRVEILLPARRDYADL